MIAHLVLFRPRPDLTAEDRQAFVAALERAFREIPTVRRARVGVRVTHGAAYEQLAKEDLPFGAVLEFDDFAGLKTYLEHPAHQELGARFWSSAEMSLAYDYEMGDVSWMSAMLERMGSS